MLLFLSLAALALSCGSAQKDVQREFMKAYKKFKEEDGIFGSEGSEVMKARLQSFAGFNKDVQRVNKDPEATYKTENNFLSILLESERQGYYGFNVSNGFGADESQKIEWSEAEGMFGNMPTAHRRDFRSKIPPVKNQGGCGSCWAFSASATMEGQIYFTTGKAGVSLSDQELMECSSGSRDACRGGWMAWCFSYAAKSGRTASSATVPYGAKDAGCGTKYNNRPNALAANNVRFTGQYTQPKTDDVLLKAAHYGVISIGMSATRNWSAYKTGIYNDPTCKNSSPNHAIAVVGFGPDHFLVRNSWGTRWGDQGHIKMARKSGVNMNVCRMSSYPFLPTAECRNKAAGCNPPKPDDDNHDDDKDEDKDEDKDDNTPVAICHKKMVFHKGVKKGKCAKTEAEARKWCKDTGVKEASCVVAQIKKDCFWSTSKKATGKKWVSVPYPCKKTGKCDNAAGMYWCYDRTHCADAARNLCCVHDHMCKDRRKENM